MRLECHGSALLLGTDILLKQEWLRKRLTLVPNGRRRTAPLLSSVAARANDGGSNCPTLRRELF